MGSVAAAVADAPLSPTRRILRPMARALLGVVLLAALLAPASATARPILAPGDSYTYRILNNPTTGDAFGFRSAIQQNAQGLSDKLYGSLASLLGAGAPKLNFVPSGSPLLSEADTSANVEGQLGAPAGSVNVDPLAVESLTNFKSPYHDSGLNVYPHEYAHLKQTPSTLAQLLTREGGAQAFADQVTPTAAKRAGIPYTPGNYDGSYAPYVQTVQQPPYGRSWILGGQFGKTAPPTWP